jgi:hypothetical protein
MSENVIIRQDHPSGAWHIYPAENDLGGTVALCGYHAPTPLPAQTVWPDVDHPPAGLCPLCNEIDRAIPEDDA